MELKHPYIGVMTANGVSFGGDQRRSADPVVRRCGCGLVAVTDLLLYLSRYHPDCAIPSLAAPEGEALTQQRYDALTLRLRRYFPLLYPTGIPGFLLAAGLNRLFRRWHLPYAARWGVPPAVLFETVEEMLRQDLPVILAVGGNFPCIWRKDRLPMRREGGGAAAAVRAHYVTVTAMDGDTLTVSSWGKKYTISRRAYSRYVRQSSSALVSNLLYLRKTR